MSARTLHAQALAALAGVAQSDAARPLDRAMGRWLAGLAAEAGAGADVQTVLALTGALVSQQARDGHSRVALRAWAGQPFPGDPEGGAGPTADPERPLPALPALDAWTAALAASGMAATIEAARPLVVAESRVGPTVAFYRLATAEARTADRLAALAAAEPLGAPEGLADAFARYFPPRTDGTLDAQALAAAAALHGRLTAVAGGPGTGKTYTVARLLALARAARPGLRVALAAPTGKAAQRLAESIATQTAAPADGGPPATADEAQTLHRLLGATGDGRWARGPASPLAADLVVVDEASMVSLPLVDALLAALAPGARLVLLGDPDQLASVEAGAVFGDLCAAGAGGAGAGGAGDALAAFCDALGLAGVPRRDEAPTLAAPASRFASAVVTLTESRRFTAASGIGAVARAVQAGDAPAARDAFGRFDDVRFVGGDTPGGAPASALAWALPRAATVATAETPEAALAALDRFRLLAATRRGPAGVEGLNAALDALLEHETQGRLRAGRFSRGRPLIVTTNDYGAGLFNGDVGVAWTEPGGDRVLCVPDGAGGVRRVPFYRVPAHETAWALTVHKSQGSEADAVGLVLPPVGSAAAGRLTRELLYTAVTRARREAVVFGEAAVWDAGVRARTERASGLAEWWAPPAHADYSGEAGSSENDSPAR